MINKFKGKKEKKKKESSLINVIRDILQLEGCGLWSITDIVFSAIGNACALEETYLVMTHS